MTKVLQETEGGKGMLFYCAGCDMVHRVDIGSGVVGRDWTWNGSVVAPTFEPSVLVRYDQMSAAGRERCRVFREKHGRWPDMNEVPYDVHNVCHSYVREGFIQYLSDTTHRLANNTVPLVDYELWYGQDA